MPKSFKAALVSYTEAAAGLKNLRTAPTSKGGPTTTERTRSGRRLIAPPMSTGY